METERLITRQKKRIALVAHDNKKADLLEWAKFNRHVLAEHEICSTGTTGRILEAELDIPVLKLQSGPLGGDQQIGAKIAALEIDFLIFFWDPLDAHPHDPDVKALLRIAVVWNVPVACNRASADFMFSSPLMSGKYLRVLPSYEGYVKRGIAADPPAAKATDVEESSPAQTPSSSPHHPAASQVLTNI